MNIVLRISLGLSILWISEAIGQRRPPNYSQDKMPLTSFSCRDKILGGYYADPETDCQMFHVCVKVPGLGVQDYKFLCPNDTSFDQENQICDDWYNIDCEASTLFYSDNFDLYRIGSDVGGSKVKETPRLPNNNINNAVSENTDDDYLQRSDRGENVGSDLLRGSHSGNFFSNKNRGKEDEDYEESKKKKNKNNVRKLLTGKRPVANTEAPYQTTYQPTRSNTAGRNRVTSNFNRNPSTEAPVEYTPQTENYRRATKKTYYENTQNFNQQQTQYTTAKAQNYNQQYTTVKPAVNYNQQYTTVKPVVNYNQQYTTVKPAVNYNQQYTTVKPVVNYNQQYTTAKAQNYNQQYTTVKPVVNYNQQYTTSKAQNYNQQYTTVKPAVNYNQQYTTAKAQNYNQEYTTAKPAQDFNSNYETQKLFRINTQGYNNQNQQYDEPSNGEFLKTAPSQNLAASNFNRVQNSLKSFNTSVSSSYNFISPAKKQDYTTTQKQQHYSPTTTQKQQFYNPSTTQKQQFYNPSTTQKQFYNPTTVKPQQPFYNPSTTQKPFYNPSTQEQFYNPSTTQKQFYNPSTTLKPFYNPSTTQQQFYNPSTTQKQFYNPSTTAKPQFYNPTTQPQYNPSTAQQQFYNPSTSRVQDNQYKTTVKPAQSNFFIPQATTYKNRGGATFSATDATEKPRGFTTLAPSTQSKDKDQYDYAYYDDAAHSEYDNIDTVDFARTKSKKA